MIVPAANLYFVRSNVDGIRVTSPADMLEEGIRGFKEVTQEDISLVALSGSERINASGEMIQYQTTLFAKSRAIRQLGKRSIPAHPIKDVNNDGVECGAGGCRSHFD
jgi:hypothetical protein